MVEKCVQTGSLPLLRPHRRGQRPGGLCYLLRPCRLRPRQRQQARDNQSFIGKVIAVDSGKWVVCHWHRYEALSARCR